MNYLKVLKNFVLLSAVVAFASMGCADATEGTGSSTNSSTNPGKADQFEDDSSVDGESSQTGLLFQGRSAVFADLKVTGDLAKTIQNLYRKANESMQRQQPLQEAYKDVLTCEGDTCTVHDIGSFTRQGTTGQPKLTFADPGSAGGTYYLYKMMLMLEGDGGNILPEKETVQFEALQCSYDSFGDGATYCQLSRESDVDATVQLTPSGGHALPLELNGKAAGNLNDILTEATEKHLEDIDVNLRETYADQLRCETSQSCRINGVRSVQYSVGESLDFQMSGPLKTEGPGAGTSGVYLLLKTLFAANDSASNSVPDNVEYGPFACEYTEADTTTTCTYTAN